MDLNSTNITSDDAVFRIHCDLRQCRAASGNNGWNSGILFHDHNQGLPGYRCKWLENGKGIRLHMG